MIPINSSSMSRFLNTSFFFPLAAPVHLIPSHAVVASPPDPPPHPCISILLSHLRGKSPPWRYHHLPLLGPATRLLGAAQHVTYHTDAKPGRDATMQVAVANLSWTPAAATSPLAAPVSSVSYSSQGFLSFLLSLHVLTPLTDNSPLSSPLFPSHQMILSPIARRIQIINIMRRENVSTSIPTPITFLASSPSLSFCLPKQGQRWSLLWRALNPTLQTSPGTSLS